MKAIRIAAIAITAAVVAAAITTGGAPPARAVTADRLVPLLFASSNPADWFAFDDDLIGLGGFPVDEAKRKAAWVRVGALSEPTHVVFADGSCLTNVADGSGQLAAKRECVPGDSPTQMWTLGASSLSIAKPIIAGDTDLTYAFNSAKGLTMRSHGAEYTNFLGASNLRLPLAGQVASSDAGAGEATVTGTARPGATLLVDDDDTRRVPVASDGSWSYAAAGLKSGTTRITFDEYVGTIRSATTDVDVTLAPGQLLHVATPADPAAGYAANTAFTFSGTANPKAQTVHIENFKGTTVAEVDIDPATGAWSWTRTDMGTSVWKLRFYTMKGTAVEESVILGDFAPRP